MTIYRYGKECSNWNYAFFSPIIVIYDNEFKTEENDIWLRKSNFLNTTKVILR